MIEEALFEFNSLPRGGVALSSMLAPAGAPLQAELFGDAASPVGLPLVQQGNLAALEDEEADDPPQRHGTQWSRVALGVVVLLAVAAALAWFAGS